jgi:multiple sugar transport system substrate-binding protein
MTAASPWGWPHPRPRRLFVDRRGTDTTTVTIWHYWDGTNADTFDAMVDSYNASHPGVKIVTTNAQRRLPHQLRASATSKTLPDVAIGDLVWVPQIAQIGSLANLSPLLPADTLSDINPALTGFGTIDGSQVSVPVSANNLGYMYNKTLFQKAGLDPDKPRPRGMSSRMTRRRSRRHRHARVRPVHAGHDNGEGLTWNFQVNLWQAAASSSPPTTGGGLQHPRGCEGPAVLGRSDLLRRQPLRPVGRVREGQVGPRRRARGWSGIWAADPPFEFGARRCRIRRMVPGDQPGGEQAMVFQNPTRRPRRRPTSWDGSSSPRRSPIGARRPACCPC